MNINAPRFCDSWERISDPDCLKATSLQIVDLYTA